MKVSKLLLLFLLAQGASGRVIDLETVNVPDVLDQLPDRIGFQGSFILEDTKEPVVSLEFELYSGEESLGKGITDDTGSYDITFPVKKLPLKTIRNIFAGNIRFVFRLWNQNIGEFQWEGTLPAAESVEQKTGFNWPRGNIIPDFTGQSMEVILGGMLLAANSKGAKKPKDSEEKIKYYKLGPKTISLLNLKIKLRVGNVYIVPHNQVNVTEEKCFQKTSEGACIQKAIKAEYQVCLKEPEQTRNPCVYGDKGQMVTLSEPDFVFHANKDYLGKFFITARTGKSTFRTFTLNKSQMKQPDFAGKTFTVTFDDPQVNYLEEAYPLDGAKPLAYEYNLEPLNKCRSGEALIKCIPYYRGFPLISTGIGLYTSMPYFNPNFSKPIRYGIKIDGKKPSYAEYKDFIGSELKVYNKHILFRFKLNQNNHFQLYDSKILNGTGATPFLGYRSETELLWPSDQKFNYELKLKNLPWHTGSEKYVNFFSNSSMNYLPVSSQAPLRNMRIEARIGKKTPEDLKSSSLCLRMIGETSPDFDAIMEKPAGKIYFLPRQNTKKIRILAGEKIELPAGYYLFVQHFEPEGICSRGGSQGYFLDDTTFSINLNTNNNSYLEFSKTGKYHSFFLPVDTSQLYKEIHDPEIPYIIQNGQRKDWPVYAFTVPGKKKGSQSPVSPKLAGQKAIQIILLKKEINSGPIEMHLEAGPGEAHVKLDTVTNGMIPEPVVFLPNYTPAIPEVVVNGAKKNEIKTVNLNLKKPEDSFEMKAEKDLHYSFQENIRNKFIKEMRKILKNNSTTESYGQADLSLQLKQKGKDIAADISLKSEISLVKSRFQEPKTKNYKLEIDAKNLHLELPSLKFLILDQEDTTEKKAKYQILQSYTELISRDNVIHSINSGQNILENSFTLGTIDCYPLDRPNQSISIPIYYNQDPKLDDCLPITEKGFLFWKTHKLTQETNFIVEFRGALLKSFGLVHRKAFSTSHRTSNNVNFIFSCSLKEGCRDKLKNFEFRDGAYVITGSKNPSEIDEWLAQLVPNSAEIISTPEAPTFSEDKKTASYTIIIEGKNGPENKTIKLIDYHYHNSPNTVSASPFKIVQPENQGLALKENSWFLSSHKLGHCFHGISETCDNKPGKCSYHCCGHFARDIGASKGEKVYSPYDGVIMQIGVDEQVPAYGNRLIIYYPKQKLTVIQMHASGFPNNIYKGKIIFRGDLLMLVGDTGHTDGPHMHIESQYDNQKEKTPPDSIFSF